MFITGYLTIAKYYDFMTRLSKHVLVKRYLRWIPFLESFCLHNILKRNVLKNGKNLTKLVWAIRGVPS